ncbi:hypothetical protein FE257_012837 [Aspergillus nanangensis]|uniref:Xylanolytic transcriptional activator regulatory domain-containing protein n=1 Tax=Aspergillus nanangensis TaxID=2582783 RepID=A0AAD4CFI4_ASPNN|nr:hypothetical protein FE257_012837 [Aspergillus nanangensis]
MENRIKWLESIVRERCSNVDLDRGPEGQTEILQETTPNESMEGTGSQSSHVATQHGLEHRTDSSYQESYLDSTSLDQSTSQPYQAHEIGLVSLSSGGDPRYIGPSSGFPFAKRLFSKAGWHVESITGAASTSSIFRLSVELLSAPVSLPPQKEISIELSVKYFRTVHLLYPLLHEESHMAALERVYAAEGDDNHLESFQVYMVLAIAALNLSRQCKVHLPVEGYYASAMKHADYFCNDGSFTALQCLLLLMVYALYNPSCNINIWSLNYQCLASVIDLGLQRDIRAFPTFNISVFDQEMRTRVFWVAYMFDRTICTMMGRPIGIRDEACDIRFPMNISDAVLSDRGFSHELVSEPQSLSHMSYSIHLFRLARLNSEIKYVMHSICRDAPAYAFPPPRDILTWQKDMMETLQTWISQVPQQERDSGNGMTQYCKIKYYETMILLLRPSPGIPNPADEIFDTCFHCAIKLIEGFGEMYSTGCLLYSRLVVHSILLGTLVMLNRIWKFPRTAKKIQVEELFPKFNISQNILSSIGEHWAEAGRARDCVVKLSSVTIQRLLNNQPTASAVVLSQENTRHPPQCEIDITASARANQVPEARRVGVPDSNGRHSNSPQNPAAQTTEFDFPNIFDDLLQIDFEGVAVMSDFDGLLSEIFN